ncbi:MAG TPA: lysophospholipid acyltransferase family protein [Longimicrobiales bacterium]|nr:lysophospholipid acyltransferase family protein [Longimicrobiales bacterium]
MTKDPVRIKHRVEFAAFRAALAMGGLLTDEQAAGAGARLGLAGYRLGIKRNVVDANLRIAFPDAGDDWIRETARESYAHLGRETMMMLRLSSTSREQVLERTSISGEEPARDAYRSGRGLVVGAGHLGNWEIGAAAAAARGYAIDVIAKRAANPLFYDRIMKARQRLGIGVIDFQFATRHTMRALRDGRVVVFAADQHAGRAGIWVPFFGRPASTYRGPALMALRSGAPMFLSIPLRRPDGTYDVEMVPIDTTRTGDMDADVQRVTAEFTLRLEEAVRANPGQYLWHHRRWRRPPGRQPEQQVDGEV